MVVAHVLANVYAFAAFRFFARMQGNEHGQRPAAAIQTAAEKSKFEREALTYLVTPEHTRALGRLSYTQTLLHPNDRFQSLGRRLERGSGETRERRDRWSLGAGPRSRQPDKSKGAVRSQPLVDGVEEGREHRSHDREQQAPATSDARA